MWIFKQRDEQIRGLDQPAPAFVSMFQRIGQQRPQRLGHLDSAAQVLPLVELGLQGLKHNLRIEIKALHYFIEERTLDLGNCYEDMVRRELTMVTCPRLFVRPPDESAAALGAFVGVRFKI